MEFMRKQITRSLISTILLVPIASIGCPTGYEQNYDSNRQIYKEINTIKYNNEDHTCDTTPINFTGQYNLYGSYIKCGPRSFIRSAENGINATLYSTQLLSSSGTIYDFTADTNPSPNLLTGVYNRTNFYQQGNNGYEINERAYTGNQVNAELNFPIIRSQTINHRWPCMKITF